MICKLDETSSQAIQDQDRYQDDEKEHQGHHHILQLVQNWGS